MSFNTFGKIFKFTTWGESHGPAIGCVIDGCPPNIPISDKEIQKELEQRNEQVVAAMQEEKQANKQQKEQRTSNYIATRRSGGGEEEKGEAEFLVPQKELLEYHAD